MKPSIIAVAVAAALLSACSSTKQTHSVESAPVTALNSQKLKSTFTRKGVKVEWDCKYFSGITDATCIRGDVTAIEATGYAPSYGASEVIRENAFKVAHDQALAKMIRFVKQDISTNRVVTTLSKNMEQAEDNIKRKIKHDEQFEMTDEEAMKDTNIATRKNVANTVQTVTENIRTNSGGIIKGAKIVNEEVVGPQTVKVVVRWDVDNERAAIQLGKRFKVR